MATKEERKVQNQKYLADHVDKILRNLTISLLKDKPDDVVQFIYNWCKEQGAKDIASPVKADKKPSLKKEMIEEDLSPKHTESEAQDEVFILVTEALPSS